MPYTDIKLNINGFEVNARYFHENIERLFLPLLNSLYKMKKAKDGRLIVFLAAPPGAGKTTLSFFLAQLSESIKDMVKVQSIGIDGFHYPQNYIEKHNVTIDGKTVAMRNVKGSPETYDLQKLTDSIKQLRERDVRWPIYDRNLHDVVPDAILVHSGIVLIEGNWLLLNEKGWSELQNFCDYSIFITAEENMLKDRLIQRKIAGGTCPEKAREFYIQSDGVNVARAIKNRLTCDLELSLTQEGKYSITQA